MADALKLNTSDARTRGSSSTRIQPSPPNPADRTTSAASGSSTISPSHAMPSPRLRPKPGSGLRIRCTKRVATADIDQPPGR